MPRNENNQESLPPPVMTWKKASPFLIGALIFDALRIVFEWFWFFGPALASLYCTAQVADVAVIGGVLEKGCAAGALTVGIAGAPAIEMFGSVMAMAVGLFGWLTLLILLMLFNSRIFKENSGNMLWFFLGLGIAEIPFVGTLPGFIGVMWKMFATQIKKDAEVLKRYEEQKAADQLQEQQQYAAQFAEDQFSEQQEEEEVESLDT